MEIVASEANQVIRLACLIPKIDVYDGSWVSSVDPIPLLLEGCSLDLGYYAADDIASTWPSQASPGSTYAREQVVFNPASYASNVDWANYGTSTEGLRMFMRWLSGESPTFPSFSSKGENNIEHGGILGRTRLIGPNRSLFVKSDVDTHWDGTNYFVGADLSEVLPQPEGWLPRDVICQYGTYDNAYTIHNTSSNVRPGLPLDWRIRDIASRASSSEWGGPVAFWYGVWNGYFVSHTTVSNFRAEYSNDRTVDIFYDLDWRASINDWLLRLNPRWVWSYHCHIRLKPTVLPPLTRSHFDYGDVRTVGVRCVLNTTYVQTVVGVGGWGYPYPNPSSQLTIGQTYESSNSSTYVHFTSRVVEGQSSDVIPTLRRLRNLNPGLDFVNRVRARLPDIRCSSFLSLSDAFDDLLSYIDTNLIESLVELREIASLIPDFKRGLEIIRGIRHGKLFDSVIEAKEFLSGEYLRATFGYIPDVDLVANTLPRIGDTIVRLSSLAQDSVRAYGTYTFDFPEGEFGVKSSRLVTRTRVIARRTPNESVRSILNLNALGILPSFSNAWDLIPFSFVIDWILNVSGRLRAMENIAQLALLDVVNIVHSYTVLSTNTDDFMDDYHLEDDTRQGVVYRYYLREITRYITMPKTSRYDFSMPSRQPNWLTVSALFS